MPHIPLYKAIIILLTPSRESIKTVILDTPLCKTDILHTNYTKQLYWNNCIAIMLNSHTLYTVMQSSQTAYTIIYKTVILHTPLHKTAIMYPPLGSSKTAPVCYWYILTHAYCICIENSDNSEYKDEKMKSWWSLRISILTQRPVILPGVLIHPLYVYIHVNSYDEKDTSVPFMFKFNTWD